MKYPKIIILTVLHFLCITALAQEGIIRGTVIDDASGEPLFGVTVQIKGTTNGAITDFDGKFSINAAVGTYDILVSFVSFQTVAIQQVVVAEGEVTLIEQIRMKEDVELLEEVVVTAEVLRTTESALLTVKRKSANLVDGISAASFKKIGDSDAAGAVKRVTGVSVEGGKYVYVRGLGDRYTKTTLNSVDIPGLDPDRNSLQIDIFPTSLLSNMVVLKSATADLPADFTGGLVNIETKDFPDEKIFDVSVGISFNPSMHFRSDALTYAGSRTDWLGFDSGLRGLPVQVDNRDLPFPFIDSDEEVRQTSELFSSQLDATSAQNFMNYSLSLTTGNQKNLSNGNTLGYVFSATYKRSNEYYRDVKYGEYQKRDEANLTDFGIASLRQGAFATENVLLGGLGGLAYKTKNAKYKLSAMHLQNGEKKTAALDIVVDPLDDFEPRLTSDFEAIGNNLEYSQRSLTHFLVSGEHHLNNNQWTIDWKIAPSISRLTDPDIRSAAFSTQTGQNRINAGEAGPPNRIWRFLDETNYVAKVDLTKEATFFGRDAKVKLGTSLVLRDRAYSIQQFQVVGTQSTTFWDNEDTFNDIISQENLFRSANGNNIYYSRVGITLPNPNAYESNNTNLAAYLSGEFSPLEKLKIIVGLRVEKFSQKHTGMDQEAAGAIANATAFGGDVALVKAQIKNGELSGNLLDDEVVLDATDLFPSFNGIYALNEKQNLRVSYAKTIARPSFKELSFANIVDPVSNRSFNGGFFPYEDQGEVTWDGNLTETRIDNFDIRWELFMKNGELFSISGFYKTFDDPIELVRITTSQTGREFQPRNVGNGQLAGAEIEFRKNLGFLGTKWSHFSLNGNVTLVNSQIDMTSIEFESRKVYEKEGENIENTRVMAGQAPYVLNLGIQYDDYERGWDASLFYNVKGETLTIVGEGFFPDIYAQPFHSLNFNCNATINKDISMSLSVSNILNDRREEFFTGFNANDEIFNQLSPGLEIGLSATYSF